MGSRSPMGRGNFEAAKGAPHCKVQGHSAVICAITAKPIKMPLGLWAQMGPRNHVLDGGPAVLRDIAMATNSGTLFAITGFVGYNFGCMIGSDTLFDSRACVFGIKLSDEDIAEIECLRLFAMATNFGTKIAITGFA